MSELRKQMQVDMEIMGVSPITIKYYLAHVSNFAKHLSERSVNTTYSALKFFYTKTLDKEWKSEKISRIKERRKLPVVLSQSEVKAILQITTNLKHKAILTTVVTAYAASFYSLFRKLSNFWFKATF